MIFNTLYESSQRGELMLIDGGFCHFHLRRDEQLTIREIISQRPGVGQEMLKRLCAASGATSLFAKCPAELPANDWYQRRGFEFEGEERTRNGRVLSLWRLPLPARPSAWVWDIPTQLCRWNGWTWEPMTDPVQLCHWDGQAWKPVYHE